MRRGTKITLAIGVAIWIGVVGMYFSNPFGTATWDPRARLFGHTPYRIPSTAMAPTLLQGDFVIAKTYVYARSGPEFGDLVVFVYPVDGETPFVKRVIGTPGDEVEILDGTLYLNGQAIVEPHLREVIPRQSFSVSFAKVSVPPDHYFVLGDNRDNSRDSRFWGFVPRDHLIGRIDWIVYAEQPGRIGRIHGGQGSPTPAGN